MKSLLQNPAFKFIIPEKVDPYAHITPPLRSQSESKITHTKLNLKNKGILPDFSYARLEIKEPTWGTPSTRINLSLTYLPKDKKPTKAHQKVFKGVVDNK